MKDVSTLRVGVVNYGAGNLHSVVRALDQVGVAPVIVDTPLKLSSLDVLLLPGVGAFSAALERLEQSRLRDVICEWAASGLPLVGICLGMHLLYELGFEGGTDLPGLGLLKGRVERLPRQPGLQVPHMGWNQVRWRAARLGTSSEKLADRLAGTPVHGQVDGGQYYYFAHSYYPTGVREDEVYATVRVGASHGSYYDLPAVVGRGSLVGFQFHPEKSGEDGLKLLARSLGFCHSPQSATGSCAREKETTEKGGAVGADHSSR